MSNIENVAAKIRALLNMTEANGASENEALIAMSKARKLMDEHNLSMDEVALKAEGTTDFFWIEASDFEAKILTLGGLWEAIEALCEVKYWNHTAGMVGRHRRFFRPRFFGFTGDVMFAKWLSQTLVSTIERETNRYMKATAEKSVKVKVSFAYGMAKRIADRIWEEVKTRNAGRISVGGTGLVVVNKNALVDNEFKNKMKIRLQTSFASERKIDGAANKAGQSAANNVNWSRPINNGNGVLAIKG